MSEMDAAHDLRKRDLVGTRHFREYAVLLVLCGVGVREHAEAGVHHDLRDARRHRVQDLAELAEPEDRAVVWR